MSRIYDEVFLSDVHFPFEDKAAWQLTLKFIRKIQPAIIWLGGDILDMYKVSHWEKDPRRKDDLQDEFDYGIARLQEIKAASPNSRIFFKEGNHETRFTRYLNSRARELRCLKALEIPALLDLESLGIEWIDNNTKYKIGGLWHIHGNEIYGRNPWQKYSRLGVSVIYGHHHERSVYYHRAYTEVNNEVHANPCLCDLQPDYDHHPNWSHGITYIEHYPNDRFHVQPINFERQDGLEVGRLQGYELTVPIEIIKGA